MENKIEFKTDGTNVYANFNVNASKTGIYILGVLILLLIAIVLTMLLNLDPKELSLMAIPLIIVIIFVVGYPIKYFLWNLYGNESLIVTTKSISFNYDYGFYNTNLSTIEFDKLGTGFEVIQVRNNREVGKLLFYNYRSDNGLPEIIHETTVLVNLDDIKRLDHEINRIFMNSYFDSNGFIPYSNN